jgi:hypothetical protein
MAGGEAICYPREAPGWDRRFVVPLFVGLVAAGMLVSLYLGIVTWSSGQFSHARELVWGDRYVVGAIAFGFGLQAALYAHLRLAIHGRLSRPSTATAVGGTGASSAAMVACCAHHVADALPVLGLSGATVFLQDYRLAFMAVGLGMNAIGVAFMLRLLLSEGRRVRLALAGMAVEPEAGR